MPDSNMKSSDVRSWRPVRRLLTLGSALCVAGLILSGCPSGAPLLNKDDHLVIENCDPLPLFEQHCQSDGCHELGDAGEQPDGGVDLLSPGVAARLVGVPATYPDVPETEGCPDPPELLIDPNNWEASLLWTKLNNTQACGDGMPIPHAVSAFDETQMACVEDWIKGLIAEPNAGTGGSGMGGAAGSGGAAAGSGGAAAGTGGASAGMPLLVQAECAHGLGCPAGASGSQVGGSMLETDETTVGFISTGVELTYSTLDVEGFDTISLRHAKMNTDGTLEVRLGSATGTLLASIMPTGTGDWTVFEETISVPLSETLTGTQTIVLVAIGESVLNLDWFELSAGGGQ